MPPTMVGVLPRYPDRYGTKLDTNIHVGTFSKAARAFDVLRFVMGQDIMDNQEGGGQTGTALENMSNKLLHDKRLQAGALEGKIAV